MSKSQHRPATTVQQQTNGARNAVEAATKKKTRRNRLLFAGAAVVGVAGLVTLGALTGKDPMAMSGTSTDHAMHAASAHSAGTALPPWPNPADPSTAIVNAGLTPAGSEGMADHFHAHLDVIVNGQPVPVAANIGADEVKQVISPLHTHDGSGAIHIESPVVGDKFYLGQLFTEWDVALSDTTLGGLHVDNVSSLRVYVNGEQVSGDPAGIVLAEHQEIAIVFGPVDEQVDVPSSYDFGDL